MYTFGRLRFANWVKCTVNPKAPQVCRPAEEQRTRDERCVFRELEERFQGFPAWIFWSESHKCKYRAPAPSSEANLPTQNKDVLRRSLYLVEGKETCESSYPPKILNICFIAKELSLHHVINYRWKPSQANVELQKIWALAKKCSFRPKYPNCTQTLHLSPWVLFSCHAGFWCLISFCLKTRKSWEDSSMVSVCHASVRTCAQARTHMSGKLDMLAHAIIPGWGWIRRETDSEKLLDAQFGGGVD